MTLDRFLLIEWMDAVASNWAGQDGRTQMFMDRWWWELFGELKFEALEFTPGMWAITVKAKP
jgi:hypothetical protein